MEWKSADLLEVAGLLEAGSLNAQVVGGGAIAFARQPPPQVPLLPLRLRR